MIKAFKTPIIENSKKLIVLGTGHGIKYINKRHEFNRLQLTKKNQMAWFDIGIPFYNTPLDWCDFVNKTLIPDLRDSGQLAVIADFKDLIKMIRTGKLSNPILLDNVVTTLVPDLVNNEQLYMALTFLEGYYWVHLVQCTTIAQFDLLGLAMTGILQNIDKIRAEQESA